MGTREERGLCRDLHSDCYAPDRDTSDERAVCACGATVLELTGVVFFVYPKDRQKPSTQQIESPRMRGS